MTVWQRLFCRRLGFVLLGLGLSACERMQTPQAAVGQPLPELSVYMQDGREGKFELPDSRLHVVNIWAIWCPPCREEMPSLQRLADSTANKGLQITGLAVEEDGHLLAEYLRKYQIRFPVVRINREQAESRLALRAYPLTLLTGPDGQILARLTGAFEWDDPAIKKLLLRLVQKQDMDSSAIETVFRASQKAAAERRRQP